MAKLTELWDDYINGVLPENRVKELLHAIATEEAASRDQISLLLESGQFTGLSLPQEKEMIIGGLMHKLLRQKRNKQRLYIRAAAYTAVAATLLAIVLRLVIATPGKYLPPARTSTHASSNIPPGKDQAILILADGSRVMLHGNGHQSWQQGATGVQQQGNSLVYNVSDSLAAVSYNTLSTPRGGQFRITLPDGTKAWLNAASSLRYPTAFRQKERVVEVSGEVYLEVEKNAAMPFKVITDKQTVIEVLGTSFNVNAYDDEEWQATTLIEGSVKVTASHQTVTLKPDQQAQISHHTAHPVPVLQNIDAASSIAWKNGLFQYNKADLRTVLRQLARWYNVDIHYGKDVPVQYFSGKIQRSLDLSSVIELLKRSKVTLQLEGKKITVLP